MPDVESSFLTFEWVMLLLRIAFIGLIYLFLYRIAQVALRELVTIGRAAGQQERQGAARVMNAALVVIDPAASSWAPGARIPLATYTTVGRSDDNALIFDDSFTSSSHAEILHEGDGWLVRDLTSTNGTFVNGRRVHGQAWIQPDDEIGFGSVLVTFSA